MRSSGDDGGRKGWRLNISGGEGEEHIGRHLLHVEGGEGHDGVQYVEKILIRMSKSCFC